MTLTIKMALFARLGFSHSCRMEVVDIDNLEAFILVLVPAFFTTF